jgi:hypothetical protein
MRITKEAIQGYILEEVLAYLIRHTGYDLLVEPSQDPEALKIRHNGLVVIGRGTYHQVDVLGQLKWIPAFTYPLRLFVEAKFRKNKTGIEVVRNLVGTIIDINQKEFSGALFRQRFHYAAALFSPSGFTENASQMALAHGVSLLDMGTPDFEALLDAIASAAENIIAVSAANGDSTASTGDENVTVLRLDGGSRRSFLGELRQTIRRMLGTVPRDFQALHGTTDRLVDASRPAAAIAQQINELFVGMANGPFMLVLKADNPSAFLTYCKAHPTHSVNISWTLAEDNGRTWSIRSVSDRNAYTLKVRIPENLGDWIFSQESITNAALDAKERYLGDIMIYRYSPAQDLLIRLKYNRQEIHQAE